MSILLSALLIIICIICFLTNRYNILLFLLILSLFGDIFEFQIGVSLKLHHFIVLMYIPRLIQYYSRSSTLRRTLRPLVWDYLLVIILGLLFGFIIAFNDPYEAFRTFAQRSEMRAVISSVRILLELSIIVLIVYWFSINKINIEMIIKTISIVLILNVGVALIDFFNGYIIKNTINPGARFILGRFTGFSGEPRAFGKYCSFGLIFLLFFKSIEHDKLRKTAIIVSIIGLSLSLSASSIVITIIGVGAYLLYERSFGYLIPVLLVFSLGYVYIQTNNKPNTMNKINMVLGLNKKTYLSKRVTHDEPEIFRRFEVFDRAALNFFYHNIGYLVFGTGPNLISIPASPYLDPIAKSIFKKGINSTPHSYFVNILSNTGIVGMILNLSFFIMLFGKLQHKNTKYFLVAFCIMSLMVGSSLIYLFSGLIIAPLVLNQNLKIAEQLKPPGRSLNEKIAFGHSLLQN